jgi:hypothetical protein
VAACRRALTRPLTPAEATSWGRRLLAARTVTFPDGQQVATDNRDLARSLAALAAAAGARRPKRDQTARQHVLARLDTLDALLSPNDGAPPPAAARDADPQRQAATILAGEEFRRAAQTEPPKTWWDRMWERIGEAIASFFRRLFGNVPEVGGTPSTAARWVVVVLVGLVALLALFLAGRTLRDRHVARQRPAGAGGGFDLADDLPDPLGAARRQADAGDYRSALRLAYIASLRRLSASGLLVLNENKTNWEYQRALRGRSRAAYERLLPVTRDFDRVWYGRRAATREEYERAVAVHDALPAAPAPGRRRAGDGTDAAPEATAPAVRPSPGRGNTENPW